MDVRQKCGEGRGRSTAVARQWFGSAAITKYLTGAVGYRSRTRKTRVISETTTMHLSFAFREALGNAGTVVMQSA